MILNLKSPLLGAGRSPWLSGPEHYQLFHHQTVLTVIAHDNKGALFLYLRSRNTYIIL